MSNKKPSLIDFLSEFVTDNKKELIQKVLSERTRHISVVLEDLYQSHNANAVIRTAECLGVQDIHIIENRNEFKPSKGVSQGAVKWLSLKRWNDNVTPDVDHYDPDNYPTHNTEACLTSLKEQGVQLIATTPDQQSITLDEVDLSKPTAFLFGTEAEGLTSTALKHADAYLKLSMVGFTESYNISVAVAITLSQSIKRLRESGINWQLSATETQELTLEWYKKCAQNSEQLVKKFESL